MGLLLTLLIGLLAGFVAKLIMPGSRNEPKGFVMTMVLGVIGAVTATFLGRALGLYAPGEVAGLFGAIVGAIIVLAVFGALQRGRA